MSDKFIDTLVKVLLMVTLSTIALGIVAVAIWLAAYVLKLT